MNFKKHILFGATFLGIVGAAAFLLWLKAHQQLGKPGLKLDLPPQVLDYQSIDVDITPEEKGTLPADTRFARRVYYKTENGATNYLQLNIVLMGSDRTSIHKPQFCLEGQGWKIERTERFTVPIQQPYAYSLPVMKLTASKPFSLSNGQAAKRAGLYVYWFVADQAVTAEHWQRMWWMAKNLFTTGVLQRWAYVSCFATCWPGEEEMLYKEMGRFLANAVPDFQVATPPAIPAGRKSPARDAALNSK